MYTIGSNCRIALIILSIAVGSGCAVFLTLSIFFMPFKVILWTSIIISVLVGALTRYYTDSKYNNHWIIEDADRKEGDRVVKRSSPQPYCKTYWVQNSRSPISDVIFYFTYIALFMIVIFSGLMSNPFQIELYEPWQQFTVFDTVKLVSAILLCFFFPGYALIIIILSVRKKKNIRTLPKVLLGYIFSMAINGIAGYITALMGFAVPEIKIIIIIIHVIILVFFLQQLQIISSIRIYLKKLSHGNRLNIAIAKRDMVHELPRLIIYSCLLALVVLSTYVIYNGVIVGDQWSHHGRALQFISGGYKDITFSNIDFPYPPLLSAILSSFFAMANVTTLNAYASIGFLNMISVFAFYYFFQNWIPGHRKRAALLAAALFVLGSWFGWINAINIFVGNPGLETQESAMLAVVTASKQTYDIRSPNSFLLASHPDFSTGVQLIVLPVGFVLLGILKDEEVSPKKRDYYFMVIVLVIVVFGIFSHDEIYLFIIIVCLLPIIFGLRDKDFIYIGILAAIGVVIVTNYALLPALSVTTIVGVPLMVLSFLFVAITWVLYSSSIFEKLYRYITLCKADLSHFFPSLNDYSKFSLSVILVSVVLFFYSFSYITWGELSTKEIEIQISELFPRNVPWYLYPMKLGLIGILGIFFILSYIFRKFEKEIFVFGVIAIVALATGPYYDEQRFNKYVMVALGGFASLLIYDLLVYINNNIRYRYLLSGVLVATVIVISSLSTLMFIGFQASALETSNLDLLWEGRRNFPSSGELHMLQFLQNSSSGFHSRPPEIYNIVTLPDEYNLKLGLIGKFEAFLGVPIPKMLESSLSLNSSTLESFYNLLARSDARFIVVPTKNITDRDVVLDAPANELNARAQSEKKEQEQIRRPNDILSFALENFQRIYQDNNFIILSVPRGLTPPSSMVDTALILPGERVGPTALPKYKMPLYYRSEFFNKIADLEFTQVKEGNKSIIIDTYNKSQTLWSKDLKHINGTFDYVQAQFRITAQNGNKEHNECGIVWEDEGQKKYYVRIRDDKLQFSEIPSSKERTTIESRQVKLNEWIPYSLKLLFSDNSLSVHVDNIPRLKITSDLYQGSGQNISRIGIRCSGNIAEFGPVEIARNQQLDNDVGTSEMKQQAYEYYYPLSALALSDLEYDTFLPKDDSVFSNNNIILTTKIFNEYYDNNEDIDALLNYVSEGGSLTIISTDSLLGEWLTKIFAIRPSYSTYTDFNYIVESNRPNYSIALAGSTIDFKSSSSEVHIKAYYQKNNKKISPFILEKNYGDGKIILVNAAGYFNAISQSPDKYFLRLANLTRLIDIEPEREYNKNIEVRPSGTNYFIGNLNISGSFAINTSSFSLPSENIFDRYYVQDISFMTAHAEDDDRLTLTTPYSNSNDTISLYTKEFESKETKIFRDITMTSLDIYGPYKVTIKSFGNLILPSPSFPLSQSDYISTSIPAGFDMILTMNNETRIKITMANGTERIIKFNSTNGGNNKNADESPDLVRIYFHQIRPEPFEINYVPILIKRPEISAYGNATFESLFKGKYDFDAYKGIEGNLFETREKNIHLKLGYVDSRHSFTKNKQMIDYITYLGPMDIHEISKNTTEEKKLRIPGDISDDAKQKGILVPWKKAMISDDSIYLALILSGGSLLCLLLFRYNQHKRNGVARL